MTKDFRCAVAIVAPIERVFAGLTDLSAFHQWMPGFESVQTDGSLQLAVGSVFRETRRLFGQLATEEFVVAACEAPTRLVLRVDASKNTSAKGMFYYTYLLSVDGEGCRLELAGSVDMPGFFATIFGGLMIGMFKTACQKDLAAFAAWIAAQPAVAGACVPPESA